MTLLGLGLGFLLSALVGGNNISACVGTIQGTRMLPRKVVLSIATAGALLGYLLEGGKLQRTRSILGQDLSGDLATSAFFVVALLFLAANTVRVPISLTHSLVGTRVGMNLMLQHPMDLPYLTLLLGSWVITPFMAFSLSAGITRLVRKYLARPNLWEQQNILRIGLTLTALYTSYVLGANTLGFIGAVIPTVKELPIPSPLLVAAGFLMGVMFLGRGVSRRVGEDVYQMNIFASLSSQAGGASVIELFTQMGVPVSVTQATSSGVLGSAFASPIRIVNIRAVLYILSEWLVTPIAGLILGAGVVYILY